MIGRVRDNDNKIKKLPGNSDNSAGQIFWCFCISLERQKCETKPEIFFYILFGNDEFVYSLLFNFK